MSESEPRDPREPMTAEEVRELLTGEGHFLGHPSPWAHLTWQRMMATLAEWLPLVEVGPPVLPAVTNDEPEDDRLGLPEEVSAVVLFPMAEDSLDMRLIFPKGTPLNEPAPVHVAMAMHALDYVKQVAENGPPGDDDEENVQGTDPE